MPPSPDPWRRGPSHLDPDLVALWALGEDVESDRDRIHAGACEECSTELSAMHRLAQVGRKTSPETTMATPDHRVWARVRAELGFNPNLEPPTLRNPVLLPSDILEPPTPARLQPPHGEAQPSRRSSSWFSSIADVGRAAFRRWSSKGGSVIARVELRPTGDNGLRMAGTGVIGTDQMGRRVIEVTLHHGGLAAMAVRRAWLVHHADQERRQPLGFLDGRHGLWTIDRSIDLTDYGIFEITEQHPSEIARAGQVAARGELILR